jgi:CheY-like chemotaxis protein
VLVVDDEPEVRRIVGRVLASEGGFRVVEAANGIEALARCATGEVGVVVADLRMPGMDGRELGRRLAAEWPSIRVLFLTAFPGEDAAELPGPVMVKPYSTDAFLAAVGDLADCYWRGRGV